MGFRWVLTHESRYIWKNKVVGCFQNTEGFLRLLGSLRQLSVEMKKRLLARRLDLLKFIKERKLAYAYEIEERFGYSNRSVPNTLMRLKKAGLIINMTKGCWELTEDGFRKLKYHGIR